MQLRRFVAVSRVAAAKTQSGSNWRRSGPPTSAHPVLAEVVRRSRFAAKADLMTDRYFFSVPESMILLDELAASTSPS